MARWIPDSRFAAFRDDSPPQRKDLKMDLRGNWNYPTTVRFGAGRISELGEHVKAAGMRNPLLVTDPTVAKMPMTGSPDEGRDCIAQVPLGVTSTGILTCPKILFISAKKLFRFVSLEVNCPSASVRRGFLPSADCRAADPGMDARAAGCS